MMKVKDLRWLQMDAQFEIWLSLIGSRAQVNNGGVRSRTDWQPTFRVGSVGRVAERELTSSSR